MPKRTYKRSGRNFVCSDCSAVVRSKEQHQDWHERIVDVLKLIVQAS